ncbi:P-loop containing nucleoside triphosphate hydrolase protein [Poronia punctata]|nr:P-loop containing nucleoside triphosphate hydrolase protein [Poronia punctata]
MGSISGPRPGLNTQEELEIIQRHLNFDQSDLTGLPEWRTYPEIPTAEDLNPDWENPAHLDKIHSLLPNTWDRPWADKNTYLETHYRLQREEAISMLRYSIKKYRQDPQMEDDDETWIYTKVYVQGYLMTRLGPMCRVQFSTERAGKRVRWSQTRRLTTGNLVALSTAQDNFKTICMPATIADHTLRDGLDQNPPTIQIFWSNMKDAVLDPTAELVMIEARFGYFEAVRHGMVGLQHVANTPSTLDKYLVNLDKSDLEVEHVQKTPMNLASLVHHIPDSSALPVETVRLRMAQKRESLRNYKVLRGIHDDISPYTNLDNSQLNAVHRILTKELAIVQGPPGTGKTFTSVQALNILLDTQAEHGSNTIIVAAQTNHAVDQILTLLIKRGFLTLRLGGRSQDEDIKRYSMHNLRKRATFRSHAEKDYRVFEDARKRNIKRLGETIADVFPHGLLDPHALEAAGLITRRQRESLQFEDGWASASASSEPSDLLSAWLGDGQIEAPPMNSADPDFELDEDDDRADFDPDDYNVEPDDCIADDDDERGRIHGIWVPIKHKWTGSNPRVYTERDMVLRKEFKKGNLWDIPTHFRGAIYQFWQRQMLRLRVARFREELLANSRICKNMKANRWHRDLRCIRNASIEIIGCTTTGLCKYRGLLAALKPRTMLIEEAAETKEANIVSALYPSLQQLILVGDHQQLAPACDTPYLDEAPYYVRVSMFERLVKLNMPYTMLNMQRRMNPELRQLLSPFYPGLQDHPVVRRPEARPPVPGMSVRSYFLHHTWSEGTDENLSKFNTLEAEMIVRFVEYLRMNGVKESEITVLTFYRGQRKRMLREFRKLPNREPFRNVHTVDSYQGEENDIVILSLVRSGGPTGPHRAGFLQNSNRAVVALSRARRGLYVFGNMLTLENACQESRTLWGQVRDVFQSQNRFGRGGGLPITCQRHQRTTWVHDPEDWINHHGGCTEACPDKLACGHDCGRRCHWVDHKQLICIRPCEKVLRCGHMCESVCGHNCKCSCSTFTGAYPDDDAWDDNKTLVDAPVHPPVSGEPFTGSDGRVGRLRGSRSGAHTGRAGLRRGIDLVGEHERRNGESAQTANSDNVVNVIRETFRQVTIDQLGTRNVLDGVVTDREGFMLGTVEDLIDLGETAETEDSVYAAPSESSINQVGGYENDTRGGADRAEWELASTVVAEEDDSAHSNETAGTADDEEDLIEM